MRGTLSLPTDSAHIVAQAPIPANNNAHSSDLAFGLHTDESVDVGSAGEHLDCGAGALDFLRVSRARNEEQDAENLPSSLHA